MSGKFVRFGVLTVTVIAFARTAWVIGDCLRTRLRRRSLVPPLVTQPAPQGVFGVDELLNFATCGLRLRRTGSESMRGERNRKVDPADRSRWYPCRAPG